eukprot:3315637-Pyramimonas_sp.AAC.1
MTALPVNSMRHWVVADVLSTAVKPKRKALIIGINYTGATPLFRIKGGHNLMLLQLYTNIILDILLLQYVRVVDS